MKHHFQMVQHVRSDKDDLDKGIELIELHDRSILPPPSYNTQMMSSTVHSESGSRFRKDPLPQPGDANLAKLTLEEKHLQEHINSARSRVWNESHQRGDWLVEVIVLILRTATVVGLVFMIAYTTWRWYHLGPHYAREVPPPSHTLRASTLEAG